MATRRLNPIRLLAPYWKLLAIAFVAMLITSAADLLEPWPLKIIFDYVLGSKRMPAWLASVVDTSNRIGGRSVLIGSSAVASVDAPNGTIQVRLSRDEIKRSPSVATADIELIETLPSVLII